MFGRLLLLSLLFSACQTPNEFENFTYPNGKFKALVLSYDDGTVEDIALARLFSEHSLIGTFNLNSGYIGQSVAWPLENGDTLFHNYISWDEMESTYGGHEIAAHGQYHQAFNTLDKLGVQDELRGDLTYFKKQLNRNVTSMAYPFGSCSPKVSQWVSGLGFKNGRTINDTHQYYLPESKDFMMWNPTCHDSRALEHMETYMALASESISLLYVWGHSWEFQDSVRWENMKLFCQSISSDKGIWSVSHGELTDYLLALDNVRIDSDHIHNTNKNAEIWVKTTQGIVCIKPQQTLQL